MWKGCPATGRMSHQFDKVTHRCKCGRWQAGFAPKKEHTKPRDECQICERKQALDKDGTLGHHGYKRPGCGWIQGDCMGEAHKPYPAVDALEKYLLTVENFLARTEKYLAYLPEVQFLPHVYSVGNFRDRKAITVMIPRGGEYHYDAEKKVTLPAFETLEDHERRTLMSSIENAKAEIKRVNDRIAKALTCVSR